MSTSPRDRCLYPRQSKTERPVAHVLRAYLDKFPLFGNGPQGVWLLSRYAVTGGFCALLNNVAVIVLVDCGLGYIAASAIAFGPVLIIGYRLHAHFTFRTSESRVSFARFALGIALNFPLWIALLYVFCDLLRLSITIAAPLTTAIIFAWNFVSARWAFSARRVIPLGRELSGRQQ